MVSERQGDRRLALPKSVTSFFGPRIAHSSRGICRRTAVALPVCLRNRPPIPWSTLPFLPAHTSATLLLGRDTKQTGEQGLQLVKGAWARILVGKDKTRAALHEAKEKAGAGEELSHAAAFGVE